jgi:hypothetical protein
MANDYALLEGMYIFDVQKLCEQCSLNSAQKYCKCFLWGFRGCAVAGELLKAMEVRYLKMYWFNDPKISRRRIWRKVAVAVAGELSGCVRCSMHY